jgi:hypothetical protein
MSLTLQNHRACNKTHSNPGNLPDVNIRGPTSRLSQQMTSVRHPIMLG